MKKSRIAIFVIAMVAIVSCVAVLIVPTINNMNLGLDLQGGFEILYEVSALDSAENTDIDMSAVAASIEKRIDVLGVSEPEISIEDDRIRVQLAGVTDLETAREIISSTAVLTFRDTDDNLLMDASVLEEGGASLGYVDGEPVVYLSIADTDTFAYVTGLVSAYDENVMVIWLDYTEDQSYEEESESDDPAYLSAATVSESLDSSSVYIYGDFTVDEATTLVQLLNSGSLNFQLTEIYSNVVSATLGEGSFEKTITAGAIGIAAVMLCMILIYRFAGLISAVTLAGYTLVTLMIYTALGGTFTLSGIAGLVLGVGMAVDSSVITFERIKDCLYQGRSVQQAYKEGSAKSFWTILDSQITTLISCLVLYFFGTGSVKGFATMLLVSTVVTVLFNVTITRFLLGMIVKSGFLDDKKSWFNVKAKDIPDLSKGEKSTHKGFLSQFDFIKNAKYSHFLSAGILAIALVVMLVCGVSGNGALNLGIDFSSGTRITLTADESFDADTLESDFSELGIEVDSISLSGDDDTIATITIKEAISEEERIAINEYSETTYGYEASDSTVSPIIGQELVKNAIIMSLLSWLAISIYISIRFSWDFALSGLVALVHDVFIILAFFAIFRMEITTDIIAVLLAIIGYSINDSIVAFDRVRETIEVHREGRKPITKEQYFAIANEAMQSIATRSLITTLTTLLPVIALLVFGSTSILTFNIALFIGLIAGTLSSLFIAVQLWLKIRTREKKEKAKKEKPNKKNKKPKKKELEEYVIPGINDY